MRTRDGCIFCEIVAGRAPAHRVAEDPLALAFMDLFPVADGHTLVVSRNHAENIFELEPDCVRAVAAASRRVAHAIRAELAPDGLAVYQANGAAAGQTVWHYHVHLIPRQAGQPLALHGRQRGDEERLREIAAALRSRLETVP